MEYNSVEVLAILYRSDTMVGGKMRVVTKHHGVWSVCVGFSIEFHDFRCMFSSFVTQS